MKMEEEESSITSSYSTSREDPDDYEKVDKEKAKYLYIIREDDTIFFKIGITNNPVKRIRNLQTGNPRPLILKKIFTGEVDAVAKAEEELHTEVVKHTEFMEKSIGKQAKGGTEWFEIPDKDELYELAPKIAKKHSLEEGL